MLSGDNQQILLAEINDSVKAAPSRQDSTRMHEPPDTDALLRKVIEADDLQAFEVLYKYYYNKLCNYACFFLTSKEAARDAVSEVFLKFWLNRRRLQLDSSCRAYLFTAVRNQAYKQTGQKHRLQVSLDAALDLGQAHSSPEEIFSHQELTDQIETAIGALSPQCRTVFTLSRQEGLKYAEIAARLNISTKAVEAHISRALKTLKQLLHQDVPLFVLLTVSLLQVGLYSLFIKN